MEHTTQYYLDKIDESITQIQTLQTERSSTSQMLDDYQREVDELQDKMEEINMHIDYAKENLLNYKIMLLLEMINSFVSCDCFQKNPSCVWTWLKENFGIKKTSFEYDFKDFYNEVVQADKIDDVDDFVIEYSDEIELHHEKFFRGGLDCKIEISIPTALVEHIVEVKEQIQEEFQHLCSKHEAAIQITVPKTRDERYELYQTLKKEFEESE